jgi:hypothetical protein
VEAGAVVVGAVLVGAVEVGAVLVGAVEVGAVEVGAVVVGEPDGAAFGSTTNDQAMSACFDWLIRTA